MKPWSILTVNLLKMSLYFEYLYRVYRFTLFSNILEKLEIKYKQENHICVR